MWRVELIPVPDRSKYRFPPYWWPDEPLPELAKLLPDDRVGQEVANEEAGAK